ncbi:alpha/beta hydrolase [Roseococcus sp. SDR]|uniref:alpha/beta hydrolase n=1 Tax=Roseococcus sp. SDR TaxID=2835532 RepID=UPI001BCED9DD|nr:alpha/beta hydrolase [Roseococcus sp. SDR]MBS7792988.1 alpha/beta hydrolase [Roseococcus sp. SDR]MBV1848302.1 alpha/beta hydrolase [Roseococcus sp. SDR]
MPPRRALLALAALPLAGCSATDLANALTPAGDVTREEGLAYGPLPRHRFDLYRPANLPPDAPLLVFVHGGAWRAGSRGDYRFLGVPLAAMGCLVAIPDYRLWPEVAFPGFVEDTALAIRTLAAREPQRRLVLMGHSAGAFNAGCVALDPAWGVQPLIGGFIGLAGPYDFRREEVTPPEIFPQARIQAAPAPLRAGETPPLLLVHGAADTVVGPYHSRILAERAVAAGVPVRHVVIPGMGHLGPVVVLSTPARWLGLADATVGSEVARFVTGSGA